LDQELPAILSMYEKLLSGRGQKKSWHPFEATSFHYAKKLGGFIHHSPLTPPERRSVSGGHSP
jgi:hypothetical protein